MCLALWKQPNLKVSYIINDLKELAFDFLNTPLYGVFQYLTIFEDMHQYFKTYFLSKHFSPFKKHQNQLVHWITNLRQKNPYSVWILPPPNLLLQEEREGWKWSIFNCSHSEENITFWKTDLWISWRKSILMLSFYQLLKFPLHPFCHRFHIAKATIISFTVSLTIT